MFRLAHLSDIHLGPLPAVTYRDLASKRITGYVNWRRNRRRVMHGGVTEALLADMRAQAPDHVAVTGDLTNLALDREIEAAREWLEDLGTPDEVSVIPGNHDAYVPGALAKACRAWRPWMSDEEPEVPHSSNGFPYLRRRGPVALVGVSSARASGPFMATGHLSAKQAKRVGRLLDRAGEEGLFRIVMIHHPPIRGAAPAHKRLYGISLFQKTIRRHGAELILHGHTHLPTLFHIESRAGARVPVVGVPAAGQGHGAHKPAAQYNLFTVGGKNGDWSISMERRGLTGQALSIACIEKAELGTAPAFAEPA